MTKAIRISPFFLLFSLILLAQSQPAQNYAWLKIGAYARYTNTNAPLGRITFPNGTKLKYESLDSPSILQWGIVEITDSIAQLNLTFLIKGSATVIARDGAFSSAKVAYHKTMLVDVNTQTRDASIDGESIGKMSFWAEFNVAIGQKIEIASFPSDPMEGNVTCIRSINLIGRRIDSYGVEVLQFHPFVLANYLFDQQTGLALTLTLVGPVKIVPNSTHTYEFPNGTTCNITSYVKTKLSEKLGLEYTYVLTLDETNIEFGENLQSTSAWIYVAIFIGLFTSLATIFVFVDRRRRRYHSSRHVRHRQSEHRSYAHTFRCIKLKHSI